jgi:hypothetical protein
MLERAAFAALLAVCASSATPSSALARPHRPRVAYRSPSACIAFSQRSDPDRKTIVFRLENHCDEEVRCTLSWEVACDGQPATAREEATLMARGAGEAFEASALACGDAGWRISPARWSCAFPSRDTAARR